MTSRCRLRGGKSYLHIGTTRLFQVCRGGKRKLVNISPACWHYQEKSPAYDCLSCLDKRISLEGLPTSGTSGVPSVVSRPKIPIHPGGLLPAMEPRGIMSAAPPPPQDHIVISERWEDIHGCSTITRRPRERLGGPTTPSWAWHGSKPPFAYSARVGDRVEVSSPSLIDLKSPHPFKLFHPTRLLGGQISDALGNLGHYPFMCNINT